MRKWNPMAHGILHGNLLGFQTTYFATLHLHDGSHGTEISKMHSAIYAICVAPRDRILPFPLVLCPAHTNGGFPPSPWRWPKFPHVTHGSFCGSTHLLKRPLPLQPRMQRVQKGSPPSIHPKWNTRRKNFDAFAPNLHDRMDVIPENHAYANQHHQ